jgi:transposase
MPQNFLMCDREQSFLMPPSLREWLAEDHLAWFVLDVVGELDLAGFYAGYRADGWGRAAFDPAMMLALLLYAYVTGERSSHSIERHCREDVAFRVITANEVPDHATIACFRVRHEQALGELFVQVLGLCARAGLLSLGVVAVDSTKVAANASSMASRTYEQIAEEILADAAAIDAAEGQQFGQARGDELPGDLADPRSRRARLRQAKQRMEAEHQATIDAHAERLLWRAEREAEMGHRLAGRPPKTPPEQVPPQTKVNITDPDSRSVKAQQGFLQGYNAQAAATSEQIIIAAELLGNANDYGMLESVTNAAIEELAAANVSEQIDVVLADAGYWDSEQIENLAAAGMRPLVPPDSSTKKRSQGANRNGPRYDFMRRVIKSETGHALYRQRKHAIEPIFGQIKHNRRIQQFQRRGITACRSEWRLIATTHNILKLWRATSAPAAT